MIARRQVVSLVLLLVVVGLPAAGASGHDGDEVAGPLAPSLYTHTDSVKIEGDLEIEDASPGILIDDSDAGQTDWSIKASTGIPTPNAFTVNDVTNGRKPLRIEAGALDYSLVVDETGNVGIGTVDPTQRLEVLSGSCSTAIRGLARAATGITYGVYGQSKSSTGRGVFGFASRPTGTTFGVYGRSSSSSGRGVFGYAPATSGTATGVYGRVDSPTGWAGQFITTSGQGVYISAPAAQPGLQVASGTKSAVVATSDGSRLLYAEEATEVWFADYGFGQLHKGEAVVAIDPIYGETVNLKEPYMVFLEEYGDAELYVAERTPEKFVVRVGRGDPEVQFSYRIVAKRMGYESQRLERALWADDDPNLYPEKRLEWEARQAELDGPMPEELEE
jgi:hypothetical protein